MRSELVLGLGKSGIATARRLLAQGDDFVVYAGSSSDANEKAAQEFIDAGISVIFDDEQVEGSFGTCYVSPGIPQTSEFYRSAQAHSAEIVSEPEFAWRISPENWAAVTGTNGKTTTTSLLAYVLNECGMRAQACGNIGDTCLDAVEERKPGEILVAELSSYQLASIVDFTPRVAVLLNITPDHISWHGGFESYTHAKFRIFENMSSGSAAVITEEVLSAYPELVDDLAERDVQLVRVGSRISESCAFIDDTRMLVYVDASGAKIELVQEEELSIKGAHNVENALCAASAALAFGCEIELLRSALRSFDPLEHRLEPCGTMRGIAFFNDSKATNVDATLKALTAFPNQKIVLLLGGRDKNTDLSNLVKACEPVCRAIIAYGEAGERFFEAFASSPVESALAQGMKDAFDRAVEIAHEGDAVVLSPACASFDEFDSFEHRGEVFKQYVEGIDKA